MRGTVLAVAMLASLALPGCDRQQAREDAQNLAEAESPAQQAEIEAVMASSAQGWNSGNMEQFLAIYSDAPETSFVGSAGIVRGRTAMEETYREAYDWSQPDPSERGVLSFEAVDFRPLGTDHALYIGRYILTYPDDREPVTGLTSLVFAREGTSWRVIADHSS